MEESKHILSRTRHPHELYQIRVYNFSMKGSSVNLIFFYIMKTTVMHMKNNHILSLKKWLNTTHFAPFEDDKTDCYMQSHNTIRKASILNTSIDGMSC